MNHIDTEVAVIGAGSVGLAIARELAINGRKVAVLEQATRLGAHASGRGSGVVHSGLYYKPDSFKAEWCRRGNRLLYEYCRIKDIPFRSCGKYIVANGEAEIVSLLELEKNAVNNGVPVSLIVPSRGRLADQGAVGDLALWIPSAGVLDAADYLQSLAADVDQLGQVLLGHEVQHVLNDGPRRFSISTLHVAGSTRVIQADIVVNAAGVFAPKINIEGIPYKSEPQQWLVRGQTFSYPSLPFTELVYPVSSPTGFLGCHATPAVGQYGPRIGPTFEPTDSTELRLASPELIESIRRWFPSLNPDGLKPLHVGIRSRLSPPDQPAADFVVQDYRDHGVPGLINLFGIDSPGLTASLAIGEYVAGRL